MNVDVIIVHGKNDNKAWAEQAQASISFHGVNIIDVDAVPGDTRAARRNGFEKATAPYVSYVDPDDYVITDIPIFEMCARHLDDGPTLCGVSTRSHVLHVESNKPFRILNPTIDWTFEKHFRLLTLVHQLTVMRTEFVQKIYEENYDLIHPTRYNEHMRDLLLVQYGDWKIIPEIGYVWRNHRGGDHTSKIRRPGDLYGKIRNLVIKKRNFN
jgi:hypothetical protein